MAIVFSFGSLLPLASTSFLSCNVLLRLPAVLSTSFSPSHPGPRCAQSGASTHNLPPSPPSPLSSGPCSYLHVLYEINFFAKVVSLSLSLSLSPCPEVGVEAGIEGERCQHRRRADGSPVLGLHQPQLVLLALEPPAEFFDCLFGSTERARLRERESG